MNISLKVATEKDVSAITSIRNHGLLNKLRRGDTAWGETSYTDDAVRQDISEGSTYVAFDGTTPVGTLNLRPYDPAWAVKNTDASYISAFAVANGYSKQNVGGQLLQLALQESERMSKPYLRLTCPSDNKSLRTYYEKQGFYRADYHASSGTSAYNLAFYELSSSPRAQQLLPRSKSSLVSKLAKIFKPHQE